MMTRNRPRLLVVALALGGCALATYLALAQLGLFRAWEPLFGAGSARVLHSRFSGLLPVPDAGLGAAAYLAEAATALPGPPDRARTWPLLVGIYVALGLGLGIAALGLLFIQAYVVRAWCTLCLASGVLSLLLAAPAAAEGLDAWRWHRAAVARRRHRGAR
jgi:uncharacterized membrane protein